MTKRYKLVVWLCISAILIGVAGYYVNRLLGPTHRKWTEDVLLEDGSTIVVKRTVTFNESEAWGGGGTYNAVESESTIRFTGAMANLPPWSVPLMALVLYKDAATTEWVVVALSTSCQVWNARGEPESRYWEFRLRDQVWREVPLSPSSYDRPANLLHRYQKPLGTKHVTPTFRHALEPPIDMNKEFRLVWKDRNPSCHKGDRVIPLAN